MPSLCLSKLVSENQGVKSKQKTISGVYLLIVFIYRGARSDIFVLFSLNIVHFNPIRKDR
uniref:Uncharacterized protein n=1 Tax=Arundo donax TaxID=35708 RepID=A0A0A8ZEE9_ARUDO